MELTWLKHRELTEKLVAFGNSYAQIQNKPRYYGSDILFSPAELQVMEYVLENEELQMSMVQLAGRLGMANSSFSKNVQRLVEKGLLEKYHLEGNQKNVIVYISDKGREVYNAYTVYIKNKSFDALDTYLAPIPDQYIHLFSQYLDALTQFGVYRKDPPGADTPKNLVKIPLFPPHLEEID